MNRQEFIQTLVELLITIDRGMVSFETPLPEAVEEGVRTTVASFGDEVLPILHATLSNLPSDVDPKSLIDVLGKINNPHSVPYIVEFHRNHSNFLSGLMAMNVLRKLETEQGYLYMGELLVAQAQGDQTAFNTGAEIVVACLSLSEWSNERAIPFLTEAIRIRDIQGMPEAAINALARYPQAHDFLNNLAVGDPSLKELIDKALSQ
jgi:hypothetical protein